ncbi:MAG: glycosyltransferase, partial [Pseudomonadota bacterium]
YPGFGGYRRSHDSIEERCAFLYQDDRIEERFRFFEAITLPGIRAQTDPDFTFVVLTGTSLPDHHYLRLKMLLDDIPQAKLLQLEPMAHREAMATAILPEVDLKRGPSIQFRLDDDDGVNVRFVEKLRIARRHAQPIFEDKNKVAIDFTQGYTATLDKSGMKVTRVSTTLWTPALAVIQRGYSKETVMHYPHHVLNKQMVVLSYPGEPMFIRGVNDYNGDPMVNKFHEPSKMDKDTKDALASKFNIRQADVRRIFKAS